MQEIRNNLHAFLHSSADLCTRCAGLQASGISSVGVTQREPGNRYLHARWRIETELRNSPLPFLIARPSMITGADREGRGGEKAGAAVIDGLLSVVDALGGRRLAGKYRSQTGVQLASALTRLAYDPDAMNKVIESDGLRVLH